MWALGSPSGVVAVVGGAGEVVPDLVAQFGVIGLSGGGHDFLYDQSADRPLAQDLNGHVNTLLTFAIPSSTRSVLESCRIDLQHSKVLCCRCLKYYFNKLYFERCDYLIYFKVW